MPGMWLMNIVMRAKPRQKSTALTGRGIQIQYGVYGWTEVAQRDAASLGIGAPSSPPTPYVSGRSLHAWMRPCNAYETCDCIVVLLLRSLNFISRRRTRLASHTLFAT